MKKSFSYSFLLTVFLSVSSVEAQVTYAKPEEFKLIKSRPLIVELLEEDPKVTASLEKEVQKARNEEKKQQAQKDLDAYKGFISNYNSYMKEAVAKYWGLNPQVEYKTNIQVKALRKSKSKKYTVLFFSETSSNYSNEHGFRYFPDLTIPTLNYSRIESGTIKVDYSFFMPYTGQRVKNEMKLGDFVISLKIMKNQISEIERIKKKSYTTKDFAEDQAKLNEKDMRSMNVILDKSLIHKKTTEQEIKDSYKHTIAIVSTEEITKLIEAETDVLLSFAIPHDIAAGSVGPLSAARILYYKAFVNAKTGKIYTCRGTTIGEFNDPYFRAKEFSDYGK